MFFQYRQNNSGGEFDINDEVTTNVIIEASSPEQADDIAESKGVYFDGVEKGMDCDCCGDRWSRSYGKGTQTPQIYGEPVETVFNNDRHINWSGEKPYAYVYYLDGNKKSFTSNFRSSF